MTGKKKLSGDTGSLYLRLVSDGIVQPVVVDAAVSETPVPPSVAGRNDAMISIMANLFERFVSAQEGAESRSRLCLSQKDATAMTADVHSVQGGTSSPVRVPVHTFFTSPTGMHCPFFFSLYQSEWPPVRQSSSPVPVRAKQRNVCNLQSGTSPAPAPAPVRYQSGKARLQSQWALGLQERNTYIHKQTQINYSY